MIAKPRAPTDKAAAKPPKNNDAYRVQVLHRVVDILQAFTVNEPVLTLGQIAERTTLSRATAFRLLANLTDRGLVSQDPETSTFSLGSEITHLAWVRGRHMNLVDRAMPILRTVREVTGESTSLSIRVDDDRVKLHYLPGGAKTAKNAGAIGTRSPLYVGGGKVLLAGMSDDEIESYLSRTKLKAFTARTPTTHEALWKEVRKIRKQGYSTSASEHRIGSVAVAAPIHGVDGEVVASIHVSLAEEFATDLVTKRLIGTVTDAAARLSFELGYRAPPIGK